MRRGIAASYFLVARSEYLAAINFTLRHRVMFESLRQTFTVCSIFYFPERPAVWYGISETMLSGEGKEQRAVVAREMNKTAKDERDSAMGRVSSPPKESHLGSRDSRLYVDEDIISL